MYSCAPDLVIGSSVMCKYRSNKCNLIWGKKVNVNIGFWTYKNVMNLLMHILFSKVNTCTIH